jgi:nucleoid DNA-binding protein
MAIIGKGELVTSLRENEALGLASKAQAERIVNAATDFIKQSLLNGDSVRLSGFGTFKGKTQAAQSGSANGYAYSTPEQKSVKFSVSSILKNELNA